MAAAVRPGRQTQAKAATTAEGRRARVEQPAEPAAVEAERRGAHRAREVVPGLTAEFPPTGDRPVGHRGPAERAKAAVPDLTAARDLTAEGDWEAPPAVLAARVDLAVPAARLWSPRTESH